MWKPVPGYENLYEVSDDGRVRSLDREVIHRYGAGKKRLRGRILKQIAANGQGTHYAASLSRDGKVKRFGVHWLMLCAFAGLPKPGQECCHYDGNWRNNTLKNLRWGSSTDNAQDRKRHGNGKEGIKHHGAKLNDKKVRAIRSRYAAGESVGSLAKRFGVAHPTIGRILWRGGWSHVA